MSAKKSDVSDDYFPCLPAAYLTLWFHWLVTSPLTTPEEAQAFLASMRDKQKAAEAIGKPPAHLTADGMSAWYLQQRQREKEMRLRRQEAEQLLRGYRMTMSHDKRPYVNSKQNIVLSPVRGQLFENDLNSILESIDGSGTELDREGNERQIGRLSIDEGPYHLSGQSRSEADVGRLSIDERAWLPSDPFVNERDVGRHSIDPPEGERNSDPFATARDASGFILETPKNEEEKKFDDGEVLESGSVKNQRSSRRGKGGVPTPSRALLPDETEWRDFVSSGKFYNLYVRELLCCFCDWSTHSFLHSCRLKSREQRFLPRAEGTICMLRMLAPDHIVP